MKHAELRQIDPNQPLADAAEMRRDASAMLMAADTRLGAMARAPRVAASTSRRSRNFVRNPSLTPTRSMTRRDRAPVRPERLTVSGATRFYNRAVGRAYAQRDFSARANIPDTRKARMASTMLMAAGMSNAMRPSVQSPRAEALMILAYRARAQQMQDMMIRRQRNNAIDMADGHADQPVMMGAQARFASARGPHPRLSY